MAIKNIVFDVGNVLVKWDPLSVIQTIFPESDDHETLTRHLAKSSVWFDLNLGKISEEEAIEIYHKTLDVDYERLELLLQSMKESLVPIEGSFELVEKLHQMQIPLYIISDNTKEIVKFLKQKYDFWPKFQGVVISADIGIMKPSPYIYKHLLDSYQLNPTETLFFDDVMANVEGAKAVDMMAIQFTDVVQCQEDLRKLKILF